MSGRSSRSTLMETKLSLRSRKIGYDDYFFGNGICLIEWAELIEEILPDNVISITIEKDLTQGFDYRKITVDGL